MKNLKLWLIAGAIALVATAAVPQVRPVSSVNVAGTIAVTNTFQSVISRDPNRSGCAIQNNGANPMWVYFGPIASANKGASVVLAAGQSTSCNNGAIVLIDQVSITGTSADAFFGAYQ